MGFRRKFENKEWTEDMLLTLRKLDADGKSLSAIAATLGMTKGQVSGKVNRLGLRRLRPLRGLANGATNQGSTKPRTETRQFVPGKPIPPAVPKDNPFLVATELRPEPIRRALQKAEKVPALAVPREEIEALPEPPTPIKPASPSDGCMFPLWPHNAEMGHPKWGLFCGDPRLSVRTAYCETHFRRCVSRVIPSSQGLPAPSQMKLGF